MTDPPRSRSRWRAGLTTAFAILCGLPYLRWFEHPSLFHDDFMRAESLRNSTLGEALFRPFNEHMAPLFETVSYLSWLGAGRRVGGLPMAFLVASFVAFGATIGMLAALIRRETGSTSAALVAVALFSLSSVSAETVLWYSASSFQWAAAAALAAWYCAAASTDPDGSPAARRSWRLGSALASLAAPAFSAIGMLAAPLAGLRLLSARDRARIATRDLARAAIPASGLALYLLICSGFRYRAVLGDSLSRNLDPGAALWATARAPAWVLLPSLVGMPDQSLTMSGTLAAVITGLVLVGSLIATWRGRHRPLMVGGIAMIAGGYLLVFAARARAGDDWIMKISRYHLFPQIGLICLIVARIGGFLRRLDARPARGMLAAFCVAALLAPLQYRGMRLAAEGPFRSPDQPRLLAAAARLEGLATLESISFDQLFHALDPIQPRWAPHPWPFHPILFLFSRNPAQGRELAHPDVRGAIIAGLSPEERGIIFGGLEATRYRRPIADLASAGPPTVARLVATSRIMRTGEGHYEALDGPAYLEFQVDPAADEARALSLPGLEADVPIEVWWAGPSGAWSPDRSVRWKPDPGARPVDWAVPLDALPHWRRGSARRLRVVAGLPGPIAVGEPRFFR